MAGGLGEKTGVDFCRFTNIYMVLTLGIPLKMLGILRFSLGLHSIGLNSAVLRMPAAYHALYIIGSCQ